MKNIERERPCWLNTKDIIADATGVCRVYLDHFASVCYLTRMRAHNHTIAIGNEFNGGFSLGHP